MEFFCNWTGSSGNNIETDLAQEICNNISKSAVKRLGGNKILTTVNRICRAVSGIKLLTDNYFQNLWIHKVSSKHATQSAKKDEECMVSELVKLKAFNYIPGRKHNTSWHQEKSIIISRFSWNAQMDRETQILIVRTLMSISFVIFSKTKTFAVQCYLKLLTMLFSTSFFILKILNNLEL